jgi:hypothetical protein
MLAEVPVRWNGHVVTFGFDEVGGRVEAVEYRVEREDGGVVTISRPPLARLAAEALDEMRSRWAPQVVRRSRSEAARRAAEALMAVPGHRRGRPPLYGPDHWRLVARVYEEGDSVQAVAHHFAVSGSTAWKWVDRTRHLGLLR